MAVEEDVQEEDAVAEEDVASNIKCIGIKWLFTLKRFK